MNFNIPIILASNSPRRQQLLAGLGFEFEVKVASINEEFPESLAPQEVPEFLAKQKALAIAFQGAEFFDYRSGYSGNS